MSRQVYAPNREKIFEDSDADSVCCDMSCSHYAVKSKLPACLASTHGDCVKVTQAAQEVNQFIADNDDVFVYVQLVSE